MATAIIAPMYGITLKKPIINPNNTAYFTPIMLITIDVNIPTTKASIICPDKNLKNISLGENVEEINELFIYNSGIENLTINSENQNYSIRNGALYNKDGTIFILPVKPLGSIETYEIPEGVEEISTYAFHNQNNLKEIKLPSTLKTIGLAFNYCSNLTKIEIPSSVASINSGCFNYCQNLKEIIINKEKGTIQGSPWGNPFGDRAVFWNE